MVSHTRQGKQTHSTPDTQAKPAASRPVAIKPASAATKSDDKRQAILTTLASIPPGHVTSYGELAKRAGLPGYARFVCRVLRDLPDRSTFPWWRVIRSDARFGMEEGSSCGDEQRRRLKKEGLMIEGDRVRGPWWE